MLGGGEHFQGHQGMAVDPTSPGGLSAALTTTSDGPSLLDMSPQKQRRTDQPQLTLDAIRDLFRGELQNAGGK